MRLLRIAAIVFGIVVAIAVAAPLILLAVGLRVDVSLFAAQMAPLASEAIGREVQLDGPVYVVPSYWPTLEVHGLHLADPFGEPDAEFASLGKARIVLALVPLLLGSIELDEISAEEVRLNLIRHKSGRASWAFDVSAPEPTNEPPGEEAATPDAAPGDLDTGERRLVFGDLEQLRFRDVTVHYRNEQNGEQIDLVIEECLGAAAKGEPIQLSIEGRYQSEPFVLRIGAGHIGDLLSERPALPLDLELEIAGAALEIGLELDELDDPESVQQRQLAEAAGHYWLRFEAENLSRLTPLLGIDLPPLGPVDLRADAELAPAHWRLPELRLQVGETRLSGSADLLDDGSGPRPSARFDLTSKRFRIDDFRAEGWSLHEGATGAEPASEESAPDAALDAAPAEGEEPRRALVDPEVMRLLDARVSVTVDDVTLGDESLGGGDLTANLKDGRFELNPLSVRLPGGSLSLSTVFEPRAGGTYAQIDFDMKAFDLGVLARRAKPGTDMGGVLDVDLLIESTASDTGRMMESASGHLDVSLVPENLEAGIMDLWAVNLMAAVLPVVSGGDSEVNCAVGLFDLNDGVLTTHSLLIDTSKIQVSGEARADFKTQRVEAELQPRPKKPQFFSLGTPVQVNGSFQDFGVGVSAADMAGTVIRVVTDLATYPLRLFFTRRVSRDGAESCAAARLRTPPPE